MEKKEFSKFELAMIKRTAQNVNPIVTKKKKIAAKIEALKQEYVELDEQQQQYELPVKNLTGGYTTEDLVNKIPAVINEEGKTIAPAKYAFKYPETILPVEERVVCEGKFPEDKENLEDISDTYFNY